VDDPRLAAAKHMLTQVILDLTLRRGREAGVVRRYGDAERDRERRVRLAVDGAVDRLIEELGGG
jgi:hypothetical protein